MIVEKVSVDRVKAKLAMLSQKKKGVVPSILGSSIRPKIQQFAGDEDDEEEDYQVNIQPSKRQKVSSDDKPNPVN